MLNFTIARASAGKPPPVDSRTALFAHIYACLEGVPARDRDSFLRDDCDLAFGRDPVRKAGSAWTWYSPRKETPGTGEAEPERIAPALREWLLVDEPRLRLKRALVHFRGSGKRHAELLRALRRFVGVRQIIETREARDIWAVIIFRPEEEDEVAARLEEHAGSHYWYGISAEDHTPAVQTWRGFLTREARDEAWLKK
jgi:hypothetical protein